MRRALTILSVSGFRGIVGDDLRPAKVVSIARAFGGFLSGGCALARDTRPSSIMVSQAVVSGLMEAGCDVSDLGVLSTPALFREVMKKGLRGGVVITASHNPPEWNGVKFVVKGRGIYEEEMKSMLEKPPPFHPTHMGHYFPDGHCPYADDLSSYAGKDSCPGVKVALDPGGGTGSLFLAKAFRSMGCNTFIVNDTPGVFSRQIDPVADSLKVLTEVVLANGCDVGFAFDCDADRVVMVDEAGKKLSPDFTLLLSANYVMKKRGLKRIVASVDTTLALEEMVKELGGRVFYSKVGEVNVVREMIAKRCAIGGEGSSGGTILSDFVYCRDGALASALITRMIKEQGPIHDLVEDMPFYYQLRKKIPCPRAKGELVVKTLADGISDAILIDGVRFNPSEDSWVLIRPSRTEEVLRVSVEAKSEGGAEAILGFYLGRIEEIMKDTKEEGPG